MLWFVPLLPLAGAGAIVALRREDRLLGPLAVCVALGTVASSIWAAAAQPSARWPWGVGIGLTLAAVELSRIMTVVVPVIAAPVIGYAAATHRDDPARARLPSPEESRA